MELNNITNTGTWGEQATRLNDNFNKVALGIDTLQSAYQRLSQSAIEAVDTLPQTGEANKIYRLVGTTSYSDYMYNTDDLTTPILMATYNNAIENEPTPGSNNLVKSGGVAAAIVFDISAYHATGSTLATFADLTSALGTNGANVPSEVRKGGMSIKFVQTSDNKYVQYRLMSAAWSTIIADWQGVDNEPTAGSDNLVKSSGVANKISELATISVDSERFRLTKTIKKVIDYDFLQGIVYAITINVHDVTDNNINIVLRESTDTSVALVSNVKQTATYIYKPTVNITSLYMQCYGGEADVSLSIVGKNFGGKFATMEENANCKSKGILWIGTSIPHGKVNGVSYPDLVGYNLNTVVYNNSVGDSFLSTGSYRYNYPITALSHENLSVGKCLLETISEKELKFRPKVNDGTITESDLNKIKGWSYENIILPYLDYVDTVVIDAGFNDRFLIVDEVEVNGYDGILWDSRNRDTFIGAVNTLIDIIKSHNPRMRIVFSGHYQNVTDECEHLCAMQEWIAERYNYSIIKLWESAGMSTNFVKGSSGYIDAFNAKFGTNYEKGKQDAEGNVTELKINCLDNVHPNTDLTGRSVSKIANIITKNIKGLINE